MDVNTLFAQAVEALNAKRNDEARTLLAEVLRLNPRHEQAWLALASVLPDMRQAMECLSRALAINPGNRMAREWLEVARHELARQEAIAGLKAEPALSESIRNQPGDDEPRPVPRLGEYLLDYKFITPDQLSFALTMQQAAAGAGSPKRLGDILLEQGAINAERLNFALREQHRNFYSFFDD